MNKRCYLHIGTMKTGTTYLQNLLAMNSGSLEENGILYPLSGRDLENSHNNIAWEQIKHRWFREEFGTLDLLCAEISRSPFDTAVISSEILTCFYSRPDILSNLKNRLNKAGYTVHVVVFFREWVGYASSLYAQSVKTDRLRSGFGPFLEEVLSTGGFEVEGRIACFEYEKIVIGFASVFGAEHIICRAYSNQAEKEFLNILGLDLDRIVSKPLKNKNQSFGINLVRLLLQFNRIAYTMNLDEEEWFKGTYAIADRVQKAALSGKRFSGATPGQVRLLEKRFRNSRLWLEKHYGISLVPGRSTLGFWQECRSRLSMLRHRLELNSIVDDVVRDLKEAPSKGASERIPEEIAVFAGHPGKPSNEEMEH